MDKKVGNKEFEKKFKHLCKRKKRNKKRLKKRNEIHIIFKFGFWIMLIILGTQILFYGSNYLMYFINYIKS